MTIADLDAQSLLACCGSTNWVKAMLAAQPFENHQQLETGAAELWWKLTPSRLARSLLQTPQNRRKRQGQVNGPLRSKAA